MKRIIILAIALFAVVAATLMTAGTASAAKPGGQKEALNEAIVLGADLHLSRQGTYDNTCGGGYGPPDVAEIENTWEWKIGTGNTCWNVGGISATGLLAAYEQTDDPVYLDGALLTGDTLVNKYDTIVTDDPEGAEWEDRPFSQDIEFLVRLSRDSEEGSYAAVASAWYSILVDNMPAVANANRYIDARKSLAGWDLASQIAAALAVGETDYATGIAARLIERRGDWEGVLYSGWDYTIGSYAILLWAFAELGDNSFNGYVGEIRTALLDAQGADGSWDGGDYQTTAYAVLGLSADGTAKGAQARAWAFLRDNQTTEGGWSYPPEYGEVNSEVLMALGALDLKGLQVGLTDPQPDHGNDTGKHPLDPTLP